MTVEDVKQGLRYYDRFGEWRVMTIAEGYYLARRKGCGPAVFAVKDLVSAVNTGSLSLEETPLAHVGSSASGGGDE